MQDLLRRYGKGLTWAFIGLTFFWLLHSGDPARLHPV